MGVIIRKAEKEDCLSMFDLIVELATYEKSLHEVTLTRDQFTKDGFGSHPIWKAFVAAEDNKIVGMALFYDRYSTWKGKRLYLEDFVVTEDYRGRNIGKKLFDAVIEYGMLNNYNGMVFQVLKWNEPGINFYKKYKASFDGEWFNVSIDFDSKKL